MVDVRIIKNSIFFGSSRVCRFFGGGDDADMGGAGRRPSSYLRFR